MIIDIDIMKSAYNYREHILNYTCLLRQQSLTNKYSLRNGSYFHVTTPT